MKKNPIGTAEELIARAHKEGLVDGKNHASKDSYYTKEAPRELKLSYLDGYSKGKRENPMRKNSTVRMNPPRTMPAHIKHIDSIKAYTHGYNNGYTGKPHKNDQIAHAGDPEAFTEGYEHGTFDKRNKTNPQRPRDSGKPKRAAYSAFDAGYYDARTGGPGGKLDNNEEYNSGFSDGLKEFDRINKKNPHLQFEENPKHLSPKNVNTVQVENVYQEAFQDARNNTLYDNPYTGYLNKIYATGYRHGKESYPASLKENPKSKKQHPFRRFFPKIKPGRPAGGPKGGYWWILDIFDAKDRKLGHLIGKGTKEKATLDAKYKVGDKYRGKAIERAMLSGPYDRKPTAKTKRK